MADALSRVDAISRQVDAISRQVEAKDLAREQKNSKEVASYVGNQHSDLKVTKIQ